jgi:hypothetical protein
MKAGVTVFGRQAYAEVDMDMDAPVARRESREPRGAYMQAVSWDYSAQDPATKFWSR